MATLKEQFDLTQDKKFSKRAQQAAVVVAFEVLSEDPETPDHITRAAYAQSVLSEPTAHEIRMAAALVTDPATFEANSGRVTDEADDVLLDRLREVWSILSGASAARAVSRR